MEQSTSQNDFESAVAPALLKLHLKGEFQKSQHHPSFNTCSVSIRVQTEDVYLHPDLYFWTKLIYEGHYTEKFGHFRHLFWTDLGINGKRDYVHQMIT